LKNFKTIRELINAGVSPMTLRYFVLTVNYRKPLDFTEEALKSASDSWKNINTALAFEDVDKSNFIHLEKNLTNKLIEVNFTEKLNIELTQKKQKFIDALNNDLNTAGAIAVIYELAKPIKNFINQCQRIKNMEINSKEIFSLSKRFEMLKELTEVLGLQKEESIKESNISEEKIMLLINARLKAKKEKNFVEADKIRNSLKEKGIELIDQSRELTTWIRI